MIICKNCNKQTEDGTKFCSNCGAEILNKNVCPKCGDETSAESIFCEHCGASMIPATTVNPQTPIKQEQNKVKKLGLFKKILNKKVIAFVLVAAVIVSAVIFIAPNLKGKSSTYEIPELLLYVKDNEINYTSLKSIKPYEITSSLFDNNIANGSNEYILTSFTYLSADGNTIFYPDRIQDTTTGLTLYYKPVKSDKADGIKIDSEIIKYCVNSKANNIFYLKGADRELYQNNFDEKTKIDSGVQDFYINEDGSKIVYITTEKGIYTKKGSNDKEKIDSDSEIINVSEDLSKIYYLKENKLYLKEDGKDKVEISSDVDGVVNVYDTGEVYFGKSETTEKKISDYVDDDMKSSDDAFTEPVMPTEPIMPTEPYSWEYATWDEYYAAKDIYDVDYAAYQVDYATYQADYATYLVEYEKYSVKLTRDNIRSQMDANSFTVENVTLYYYDGKETVVVTDNITDVYDYDNEKAAMIIQKSTSTDIGKIKMSEVNSYEDISAFISGNSAINMGISGNSVIKDETCLVVKSTVTTIDNKDGAKFQLNYSASKVYFIDEFNAEKNKGILYEIEIKDNTLGNKTKYDEDVSSIEFLFESDTLIYYKDVKDSIGDLYLEKECVDSGVYTHSIQYILETKTLIYFMDFNSEKGTGTLRISKNKKSETISEVANNFYVVNEKCIVYMLDLNASTAKGDLYLYDGSDKSEKIDEDVTSILPVNFATNYRENYYVNYETSNDTSSTYYD